jgi:endonuclease/exonuclease/phosphatase family metal-dependent hydrolase
VINTRVLLSLGFLAVAVPTLHGQNADPIVLNSCTATNVAGWTSPNDCAQPLSTADLGWTSANAPLAIPTQSFEQTFTAPPASYRVWVRTRALNDSKYNDAIWLQFSDATDAAGTRIYPIGSTSGLLVNLATDANATSLRGWGWQDGAYWLQQTIVRFATPGPHTIRVQVREDGVSVDQIVLSSAQYLTTSPGLLTNDTTRLVSAPPPPSAPTTPSGAQPANQATAVATTAALNWTASTGAAQYDVAFGTTNPPAVVSANQASTNYKPATLAYGTTHYWRIVAKGTGGTTTGPVWTFTTAESAPPPPSAVTTGTPSADATGVSTATALTWTPVTAATGYTVAFGTTATPQVVTTNQAATTYQPATLLAATIYYWRVDAVGLGGTTPGTVWRFATLAAPVSPPAAPTWPLPADLETGVSAAIALNWTASADATQFDVAFGTASPPPIVSSNQAATSYLPPVLADATTYFWRVIARGAGGNTSGQIWTFTTAPAATPPPPPPPPTVPPGNTGLKRLRVFNWNVAQGFNPVTNSNDYALQIELIASVNPDIVTLQEMSYSDADMMTLFTNGLSARTGRTWHGYYQRNNAETTPTTNNTGSAILMWLTGDTATQVLISDDPAHPFEALHIQVPVNASVLDISTTHLYAWDPAVRATQILSLQTWLSTQGSLRVVAGDFNAFPGETNTWNANWKNEYTDAWQTATGWVQPTGDNGFTFDKRTATGNPERIDYEWTKGMTVTEMFVVKTRRSDHHALVVDYQVP